MGPQLAHACVHVHARAVHCNAYNYTHEQWVPHAHVHAHAHACAVTAPTAQPPVSEHHPLFPAHPRPPSPAPGRLTRHPHHARFGGQGKKLYNDLYRLDAAGGTFVEVEAAGKAPSPRRGHSMTWDGRDYLVVFGGITQSGATDNHLSLFSLSRGEWLTPQAFGPAPSPRTQHSATLLAPGIIFVFGGCNSSGTFFGDAAVLDTRGGFTWHRPGALNTAPAARYHHTCSLVGGKLVSPAVIVHSEDRQAPHWPRPIRLIFLPPPPPPQKNVVPPLLLLLLVMPPAGRGCWRGAGAVRRHQLQADL